jgi:hypothetical protein
VAVPMLTLQSSPLDSLSSLCSLEHLFTHTSISYHKGWADAPWIRSPEPDITGATQRNPGLDLKLTGALHLWAMLAFVVLLSLPSP